MLRQDGPLEILGQRFSLNRSISLADAERLDRAILRDKILGYSDTFIQENFVNRLETKESTRQANYKLINYIITEVLPILSGKEDPEDTLAVLSGEDIVRTADESPMALFQEEGSGEAIALSLIDNGIEDLRNRNRSFKTISRSEEMTLDSLLSGTIADRFFSGNFLGMNGALYDFGRGEPSYFCSVDAADAEYSIILARKEEILSANRFRERFIETELEKYKLKKLTDFANMEYRQGAFGVKVADGMVYMAAFIDFDYALKTIPMKGPDNFKDCFILFPPCTIVIPLTWNFKRAEMMKQPILYGKYEHPFLPSDDRYQSICMGDYHPPSGAPDNIKIAKVISDARKVILHGYVTGANPHRVLGYSRGERAFLEDRMISLEDIKARGIPVTNIDDTEAERLGLPTKLFI